MTMLFAHDSIQSMLNRPTWEPMLMENLKGSPQDPIWHAEGDVATHTQMVVKEMVSQPGFIKESPSAQDLLYRTALLHDIGKPACTQYEGGRIRNHGHSRRGAILARGLMYGEGYNPMMREQICTLVRLHMTPVHAPDTAEDEVQMRILRGSLSLRMRWLLMLARADNRGRESIEKHDTSAFNIDYFEEMVRERECLDSPFKFANAHSRVLYFCGKTANPRFQAFDDTKTEMVMMAGLPGSGKTTWIKKNLPDHAIVSLDEIRNELGVESGENQSRVIAQAREEAKVYLRRHQPFVFDATNLVSDLRQFWLQLAASYKAKVSIVYLEVPFGELMKRNKERPANQRVPESAIQKMMNRWEMPDISEAHSIQYVWGS